MADRITEIAAVRVEEGREVARWSTLVNPGTRIPAFIESLTGIGNAMVADAPPFEAVAPRLLELLEGTVLVAHNARFDHGFLKNSFQRMQIDLRVRTLCTVRLSRRLYPQHRSHGLDAIIQRHGLQTLARHRAMGDVDVVLAWLAQAQAELGVQAVSRAADELLRGSTSLPPYLETALSDLPNGPGVYLLYGESGPPLYVGKSVQLRARVLSHFQADHTAGREMRLAQETRRVETRRTAGELGALLLESRLVKQLQPVHNRRLRRESSLCAWRLQEDPAAQPLVELVHGDPLDPRALGSLYGVFRSRRQATEALSAISDAQGLCPRLLGLEAGRGRCFSSQLGRCRGACCGQEPLAQHRLRLVAALAAQRLQAWPFAGPIGLREHDAESGRTDIHVFDHWCHLATVQDPQALHEALQSRQALAFDLDTFRLLQSHLARKGAGAPEVFRLEGHPAASGALHAEGVS